MKSNIVLLIISLVSLCILLHSCGRSVRVCGIDKAHWQQDECGFYGYRDSLYRCLIQKSEKKPVLKTTKKVYEILGKPDTIFTRQDSTFTWIYVTSGAAGIPNCYHGDWILSTLNIHIIKQKVKSIRGSVY